MDITLSNCALMTVAGISMSIGGMYLVRRNVKHEYLRMHHDVTDPLLAVLGTLFAILLGFMLANSMERFEDARSNAQQEAGAVGDVFRLAEGLPAKESEKIGKDCLTYLDAVISEDWPMMQHRKLSDHAWNLYRDSWHDCVHYQPVTQSQSNIHQLLLESMSKTGEARRARFAELSYSLPPTLWVVLLVGGFSTVAFTYFFAIDNVRLQMLMTSVITMIICLNIYMLAGYDAPFSGDIAITPVAFESVRESLQKVHN